MPDRHLPVHFAPIPVLPFLLLLPSSCLPCVPSCPPFFSPYCLPTTCLLFSFSALLSFTFLLFLPSSSHHSPYLPSCTCPSAILRCVIGWESGRRVYDICYYCVPAWPGNAAFTWHLPPFTHYPSTPSLILPDDFLLLAAFLGRIRPDVAFAATDAPLPPALFSMTFLGFSALPHSLPACATQPRSPLRFTFAALFSSLSTRLQHLCWLLLFATTCRASFPAAHIPLPHGRFWTGRSFPMIGQTGWVNGGPNALPHHTHAPMPFPAVVWFGTGLTPYPYIHSVYGLFATPYHSACFPRSSDDIDHSSLLTTTSPHLAACLPSTLPSQ